MTSPIQEGTDWLRLIQAEYREIPGLRLTRQQMQRLWGLDEHTCAEVLDALTASRFLAKTHRDAYILAEHR
jgi:hypothetical protein